MIWWKTLTEHPVTRLVLRVALATYLLVMATTMGPDKSTVFHASAWVTFVYAAILVFEAALDLKLGRNPPRDE